MMKIAPTWKFLAHKRSKMALCLQASVMMHSWIFMGVTSNAQAQELRTEKANLLQAMAYARRAGIDVSRYQASLREYPFLPGYEARNDLAKAVHAKLAQLIDQVNRTIANGDPDAVAANQDAVLLVNSGGMNEQSHSLLVRRDGSVQFTVDADASPIGSGSGQFKIGGKTGNCAIPKEQAERLFKLIQKTNLATLPATKLVADRDDGNYLVQQMMYLDFADRSSPNLLCASNDAGLKLEECCKQIEKSANISQLAQKQI